MFKGSKKNKKKFIKMVAMVCVMAVVLSATAISVFAKNGTYSSSSTTEFKCRVGVGKGKKGEAFTATRTEATIKFTVNPQRGATRRVAHVYQISVGDNGEVVSDIKSFERGLDDTTKDYTLKFKQTVGSTYRYVLSVYKVLNIGDKANWPSVDNEISVKYPFVIQRGLTLYY